MSGVPGVTSIIFPHLTLRTYPLKHTAGNTVKITLNDNELEEDFHGGLSD